MGRAESDINSLQNKDTSNRQLYHLNERQKRAVNLFLKQKIITAKDVSLLFALSIRATNNICNKWLEEGFVEASSKAKKSVGIFGEEMA